MIGLASAWAMEYRRRPKEYRRKVNAATRCSGVRPHIRLDLAWPDSSDLIVLPSLDKHNTSATMIPGQSRSKIHDKADRLNLLRDDRAMRLQKSFPLLI